MPQQHHDLNTLDRIASPGQCCVAAVLGYRFGEIPEVYLDTYDDLVGSYLRTSASEYFGVYASVPSAWFRIDDDDDDDDNDDSSDDDDDDDDAAVMLVVPHPKRPATEFHVLFDADDLPFLRGITTCEALCLVSATVSDLRLIVEIDREGLQQVLDQIG